MADQPHIPEGEPTPGQVPEIADTDQAKMSAQLAEAITGRAEAEAEVARMRSERIPAPTAVPPVSPEASQNNGNNNRGSSIWGYLGAGALGALAGAAISIGVMSESDNDKNAPKTPSKPVPTQSASVSSSKEKTVNLFGPAIDKLAVGKAIHNGFYGAQADQEQADAAKTAAQKRAAMLERVDEAKTVPFSVKRLHSTPETLRPNIKHILTKQDAKKLIHSGNAQSSLLPAFEVGTVGPINGAEAVAYSIAGSEAFASQQYNLAHGSNSTAKPQGKTFNQIKQYFANQLASPSANYQITQPTGTFMNHGQTIDRGVFQAGLVDLDGDKEVITITLENGKTLYYKIFNNNCVNSLVPVEKVQNLNVTKTVVSNPQTTPTGNPKTKLVMTPIVSNPVHQPNVKVVPPTHTETPTTVTTPKADDGNPGAGNSPVEADKDKGNPTGVQEATEQVGGLSPGNVPRPEVAPIPAPAPPSSVTQGRPPAETGTPTNAPEAPVPGTSNEQDQGGTVDPNSAALIGAPLVLGAMGARRLRLKARQTNRGWSITPNQEEIR